jgi:hypothetical protein
VVRRRTVDALCPVAYTHAVARINFQLRRLQGIALARG